MYHEPSHEPDHETIVARLATARSAGPDAVTAYMSLRLARHAATRGASHSEYLLADGFTPIEILKYQRAARQAAPAIVRDARGLGAFRPAAHAGHRIIESVARLREAEALVAEAMKRVEHILASDEGRF